MISINLFTKCPYSTETKTRMKNFLSNEERIFLSEKMLINILEEMNKVSKSVIKNVWAYPNLNSDNLTELVDKYNFITKTQQGKNLNERMDYCLKRESSNNQKTIIFGSDIPTLDHVLLENAIKSLSEYDVVLGPSLDGGYYLLGMKSYKKGMLQNRNNNLDSLIKFSVENELNYKLLDKLKDIDFPEDLLSI